MKKSLIWAVLIVTAMTWTFAAPGFSQGKITGKLKGIKLKVKGPDGRESYLDAQGIRRIRIGFFVNVNEGTAMEDENGQEVIEIELAYADKSGTLHSTQVTKAGKIKIGDTIVIMDGKAKKKGAGRGC